MVLIQDSEYSSCDSCGGNDDIADIILNSGKTITLCKSCRRTIVNIMQDE